MLATPRYSIHGGVLPQFPIWAIMTDIINPRRVAKLMWCCEIERRSADNFNPMSTTDFERLERLEQAITLCLQEIDHNFIRCHRVATACLPIVERYAEQSRSVWDSAKVSSSKVMGR